MLSPEPELPSRSRRKKMATHETIIIKEIDEKIVRKIAEDRQVLDAGNATLEKRAASLGVKIISSPIVRDE
jgi:hypothetical protein